MSYYTTITDARTEVLNSGVIGWDWGEGRDSQEVLESLARFLWREGLPLSPEALERFIREVLHDDPELYSLYD